MNSRYVTAIDIGTSKLAAIVGEKTSTGIKIIGYSEAPIPANGVRRSEIMNPKNVISVIKTTMQKALQRPGRFRQHLRPEPQMLHREPAPQPPGPRLDDQHRRGDLHAE